MAADPRGYNGGEEAEMADSEIIFSVEE